MYFIRNFIKCFLEIKIENINWFVSLYILRISQEVRLETRGDGRGLEEGAEKDDDGVRREGMDRGGGGYRKRG